MSDVAITIFRSAPSIQGTHPLTGMPVYFIPFDPSPGRAKILVITKDEMFYTVNAGLTWEDNPESIDIREVDVILSKKEGTYLSDNLNRH